MEQKHLEKFKAWFDEYAAAFYSDDEYNNANIKLKDDHTRRTCEYMRYLAGHLQLDDNQKRIAQAIALFHDIGRFSQFRDYQTYNDPKSVNHCMLGLKVLRRHKILDPLDENEKRIIEKAIQCHGMRRLPGTLNGDSLLFAKIMRDADKLDIFHIVTTQYKDYEENPDEFKLEVELPNVPEYSSDIVKDILAGKRVDYNVLKTWNDMKLLQLAWVYDVNFIPTLERIKQEKFLESIISYLPQAEDIEKVKEKVLNYIDYAIENGI